MKGGISRLSPPKLTPRLPRLPPILHSMYRNPTSNCSKGPRGLSVLLRETSIFTRRAISPGLWLRQQPSRYAIRAGRNFAISAVSSGADYAFTSVFTEGPRLALNIDLPIGRIQSLSPRGSVVTGSYLAVRQRTSHGIARRLSLRP